jgi:hypothetical protein
MSSTDEPAVSGGGHETPPPGGRPGWQKAARRYGPIALLVVLVGAAVLVFGRGEGDAMTTRRRRVTLRPARRT